MVTRRALKYGVGVIAATDVTSAVLSPCELRRGEALVYRLLDAEGRCIYIGYTASPLNRWRAHRAKQWWPEVEAIYYISGLREHIARAIETADIRADRPIYNRTVRR